MKDRTNIKRKLLTDRKLPDSNQISQRKDFKSVQQSYSMLKSNLLKKLLIGSGVIVGTAVVALVVYFNGTTAPITPNNQNDIVTALKQDAFIQQPLPGKDVPFSFYRISAKNGGVIHHETGSTVTIPANAFVANNNLNDSVTIKYREFHNPYDIFLSGIPMHYDSAGIKYTFESAGMIEIQGYDGDKQLLLNQNKAIEIAMVSANDEKDFNLYELDTLNKNWSYKGKDQIVPKKKNPVSEKQAESKKVIPVAMHANTEEHLVKPQMSDPNKFCFNIGYDKKEFPELEVYDNVLFEVTDNSFKPAFYKIDWDKISLHSSDTKGIFIVKLKKADTTIVVNAKPVFNKENYNKALTEFEANHKKAEEKINAEEVERNSKLEKVNKDLSSYNRADFIKATSIKIDRKFSIRSFGIFNCDRPILPPVVETQQVAVLLEQRAREGKQNNTVKSGVRYSIIYVVEKGKNAVFTYPAIEAVQVAPDAQNLVWTITDKKEIAFFNASDFNKGKTTAKPVIAANQDMALEKIREFSN